MNKVIMNMMFGAAMFAAIGANLASAKDSGPSVLLLVSSEGRDAGKTRPGFEMDELSVAWGILRDNGIRLAIASPRGGAVVADAYDAKGPSNARFLGDAEAQAQLAATLDVAGLDPQAYDAVYVMGGKGAMFDLAVDPSVAALLGKVYQRGGVLAAVCHGSAALAGVRTVDGRSLVDGRQVTGFTAEEESVFGKKWAPQYPFVLEDELRRQGARWVESALMLPRLVVDGRLITGQNPYSTVPVAEALVRALGREPVARTPGRDEASLALLERAIAGDRATAGELAAQPQRFHPELVGIVGHYQLQVARTPEAIRAALAAMDLAAPHFDAPQLGVSRADALWRLDRRDEARALLGQVLATNPGLAEARALERTFGQSR